ncbi:MAG: polymer-forming cytoskeletal protein [Chloroflexi bacterium]|nr:MAG: polymer-forming cytoskeletal protein [Chloroflexota bacterium]TMF77166.1 MAG: polymer-forming cytoskeletal protein [Chloroflexota bacterium]TMF77889.1 MAG: polymer-forming cytoskeletal protein [Chloroflexota bacterium]TMF94066.1 MAG: polymer-forming cytoskeletal protein [Chloroflexota bacterium]TMG42649.1 MAG: polymer-forming cytoskeletal protein [Chloroflexota bacterium]
MSDTAVESAGATSTNGGPDPLGLDPKATVIARDDSLSGKLELRGYGQVLGSFSGEIESDGDLLIGPEAHVEADIRGARITVAGLVRGNVIATNRLKITSSGRLEGDAMVGALIVQEGGVHYGVIRVHPEGVPDTHPERLPQVQAQSTVVTLRTVPNPVGRVRKFWGEFF